MTLTQHTDDQAIRALFDRLNTAWAAGDAIAYAATFTEDAEYITWFGRHYQGRQAIENSHAQLFTGFMKGTRLDGEVTGIRFLSPDVALVGGRGAVVKGSRTRTARNTKDNLLVAVRQHGEWLFTAFHNTKVHWLMDRMAARSERKG